MAGILGQNTKSTEVPAHTHTEADIVDLDHDIDQNIDGGRADSAYTVEQVIDGGGASG